MTGWHLAVEQMCGQTLRVVMVTVAVVVMVGLAVVVKGTVTEVGRPVVDGVCRVVSEVAKED